MPRKYRADDWDRLFAPKASQRGGPLTVLFNFVAIAATIALLVVGGRYAKGYLDEQKEIRLATAASINATATQAALTTFAQWTTTAVARAERNTTPTPAPNAGSVIQGGNLRSEPRVVPETVVGLINTGDEFVFLERMDVDGAAWYRIRITRAVGSNGVPEGTEGWAHHSLLSTPTGPLPTPGPSGSANDRMH